MAPLRDDTSSAPHGHAPGVSGGHGRLDRLLSRALRPFARIEPEEAVSASLLTLTVFLVLTSYYLLKTAREPLILLEGGAEVKSYAAAGQSVLLLLVVRAYSEIAKRVGRMKLLAIVYSFFISNLLVFAALARSGAHIGVVFYLWVGIFNVMAVAQFWSFANDVYSPEQGKRVFAILGIGSSVGAVAGSQIARRLVEFGPRGLMLTAAVVLVACVALIAVVNHREGAARPAPNGSSKPREEEPLAADGLLGLFFGNRYLVLVAVLTLVLNWVNTTGEYILDRALLDAAAGAADPAAFVGAFKADFFGWVNLLGVLIQLFAVSRLLKWGGIRNALLVLPVVAFAGYGILATMPILALVRIAKIAENSINYSLQNTSRNALFLVTSRVEKYVGKTVVDTIFVRLGDVLAAVMVWLGTRLHASTKGFAAFNLVLIACWFVIVLAIGREYRRRSDQRPANEAAAGA